MKVGRKEQGTHICLKLVVLTLFLAKGLELSTLEGLGLAQLPLRFLKLTLRVKCELFLISRFLREVHRL